MKIKPFRQFGPIFASLVFLFLGTGCGTIVYEPSSENVPRLSFSQAQRQLLNSLRTASINHGDGVQRIEPHEAKVTRNTLFFKDANVSFDFGNANYVNVKQFSGSLGIVGGLVTDGADIYRIDLNGSAILLWRQKMDAVAFASAFNTLVLAAKNGVTADADLEQFKEKAVAWRALTSKPPLPEEAHKYQVLAANAVQEKRFEEAANFYEQGLATYPLWPDAQHDVALIEAELGNYDDAAQHMRCYLELVPDAQDARALRDQVIIWDEKAKEPPSNDQSHRSVASQSDKK